MLPSGRIGIRIGGGSVFSLRTELFLLLIPILLLESKQSLAVTQTVTATLQSQDLTGNIDPGNLTGPTQLSELTQSLRYKLDDLESLPSLTISGGLDRVQPDYSSYLVTERDGTQVPLSDLTPDVPAYAGALNLDWTSGSHNASLAWAGALTQSPFALQSLTLGYAESFYNKTTTVGARFTYFTLDQPDDFYIDENLVTEERPTLIHGTEAVAYVDQVFTERWKGDLELMSGTRVEDRPRNVGATLKQGYAVTDRLFGQLAFTRIAELTSEPLLNERGYFSLDAAELTFTVEPVVDLLLSASYGLVVEGENDPRSGRQAQVGSDQYGLGAQYRRGAWSWESKAGYRVTNTGLYDLGIEGGLSWQI